MLIYIYDGSFEGLLTSIYEVYYQRQNPYKILTPKGLQLSFVDEYINIKTDSVKSAKVYDSIENKLSTETLQTLYNVFLSNESDMEMIILEYLQLGFRIGNRINLLMSDDRVMRVNKINYRVGNEVHKMMGFIRFRLIEGNIYYAPIEPDHNIVELLAPHFTERMSDVKWIIHDVKRKLAVVYNLREWILVQEAADIIPGLDKMDSKYQKLWKVFFDSISISNRTNPKLQKRFMPVRYWKHLTEKYVEN